VADGVRYVAGEDIRGVVVLDVLEERLEFREQF